MIYFGEFLLALIFAICIIGGIYTPYFIIKKTIEFIHKDISYKDVNNMFWFNDKN